MPAPISKPDNDEPVEWSKGWSLFKRFWPFMRRERRIGVAVLLLGLLTIPSGALSPLILREIFDVAVPDSDMRYFFQLGGAIVALTLLSAGLGLLSGLLVVRLQNRVRHRLTRRMYDHVLRLPIRWFHRNETGYVMARVREDVQSLDAVMLDNLIQAGIDLLSAIVFFCLLLTVDFGLAVSGLVLLLVIFSSVFVISKPLRRRSEKARETDADASAALHQSLTGIQTVRTGAQERGEARRFGRFLKAAIRAIVRRDVLSVSVSYIIGLAVFLGMYVIIIVGAYRILTGASSFGSLMAFSMYLIRLGGSVSSLIALNVAMQEAFASLTRIFAILDEPREVDTPDADAPPIRGRVEFDQVSFEYDENVPALAEITLTVEPGEVLAIVGRSGAGKSTLVNLIPRLLEPNQGEIRLDGQPLSRFPLRALRSRIGVVPQEIFLFNRTIRENIAYAAPRASEEQVVAAAQAAHAHEFISRLEEGYDTLVGERGVKLSGGEKQRIAIAREILRDPAILVLDEATSSLDSESEALIRDAVDRLKRHRTCFVIAHRLSTVQDADSIVVLDRGRVAEQGRHDELLAADGLYRRLHDSQFDGESGGDSERGEPE